MAGPAPIPVRLQAQKQDVFTNGRAAAGWESPRPPAWPSSLPAQAVEGGGLDGELLEEMEAAERKDRYIDQILRKRQGRPLGAGPRGRKAPAPLPVAPAWPAAAAAGVQVGPICKLPLLPWSAEAGVRSPSCAATPILHPCLCPRAQAAGGGGARKLQAADAEREARAALAGLAQEGSEEERDSGEEEDYYWSDADM